MKSNVKVLAFYLPQFHAIPENDTWWGKGFTDWSNVRKGFKYCKGQEQPRVPLNNNYYDLTDIDTIKWQASLTKKYNVHGLCFYHYWFNGKLLLEKPAELLLSNKDISINFCFSWANEPWSRTWTGNNKQVLMPQSYGSREDWINHFNYLLPFFKDSRYIKENNCPMFLIYKTQSVPCCKEMMDCWNECAIRKGFNGIHFVETLRDGVIDNRQIPIKARVEFEPTRSNYLINPIVFNYDRIRRRLIKLTNRVLNTRIPLERVQKFEAVASRSLRNLSPVGTYGGVFVGWDNTARRGLSSTLILPPTKDEFKKYLMSKIDITKNVYKTNYVFINAWNEWAEGTYLEPDEIHRYEYLEAIQELVH